MSILKGRGKNIIETTIKVIGICSILPVLGIFAYIIFKGVPAITWSFITEGPRSGMREGGIFPVIVGSILLTLGTIVASVPFGILTGPTAVSRVDLKPFALERGLIPLSRPSSTLRRSLAFPRFKANASRCPWRVNDCACPPVRSPCACSLHPRELLTLPGCRARLPPSRCPPK